MSDPLSLAVWRARASRQTPPAVVKTIVIGEREIEERVASATADFDRLLAEQRSVIRGLREQIKELRTSLQAATDTQFQEDKVKHLLTSLRNGAFFTDADVGDIVSLISQRYKVDLTDLASRRCSRNISFPRHIAMYLCSKFTMLSMAEIGRQFGGRDHTTILHAVNNVKQWRKDNAKIDAEIIELEQMLRPDDVAAEEK